MKTAVYGFVSGRVQGVGFRAYAKSKADILGITGFVRNLPDGRVEFYAEGGEENIKRFLDYLRQGPPLSAVTSLDYKFVEPRGSYENFEIVYY